MHSGRPRPVPTGEELEVGADRVVIALGSGAEPWLAATNPGLAVDALGRPIADERGATSIPGVYAGGDIVRGAATVVHAVADGLRAAKAIDRELGDG